jgi:hypothetical protein
MTLDEASDAVDKAYEVRENAIDVLLDSVSLDLFKALEKLHDTQCAYMDALMIWGELYDAQKKPA